MNGDVKYGDVALGVEAALPAFRPEQRPSYGYARFRQTLIRLYAALTRWA